MTHEKVLDEVNVIYERISNNENNLFSDGNYTEALEILIDFYETGLIEELKKIKAELEKLEYLNIEDGSDGYDKYIEQYEALKIINKRIAELKKGE